MSVYLGRWVAFLLLVTLSMTSHAQTCNDRIKETTPESRFEISGDEVTDLQTELIWQRCSVGQSWDGTGCSGSKTTHAWSEALALASGDWRLPSQKELASIIETACHGPAINLSVFPNTQSSSYWTSSPYAGNNSGAWSVDFSNGYDSPYTKNYNYNYGYVRLVRFGQ